MNVIERQVHQTQLEGDTLIIPPMRVLARCTSLYNTVLYDLLEQGVSWHDIQVHLVPAEWVTPAHIQAYAKRNGRVVIDRWDSPVTYYSHVEPV